MSVSAKLFQVKKFPKSFPIETEPVSVNPRASLVLKTRVEELGQSGYGNFIKLNVIHDLGENFDGIGYSSEYGRIEDLFHIAREKSFPAFVDQNREWLISAFSAKDVFNQAFKRLNQWAPHIDDNELSIKPIKLDLAKMKQAYDMEAEGPQIKGGWFSKIKLLNVNVAYIGGSDVATSDDWDRYETNGLISALRLDFPNDEEQEPWKVLLAKDGAIFSYKNLPESEFLKTVIPIFDYAKQFVEKPELV